MITFSYGHCKASVFCESLHMFRFCSIFMLFILFKNHAQGSMCNFVILLSSGAFKGDFHARAQNGWQLLEFLKTTGDFFLSSHILKVDVFSQTIIWWSPSLGVWVYHNTFNTRVTADNKCWPTQETLKNNRSQNYNCTVRLLHALPQWTMVEHGPLRHLLLFILFVKYMYFGLHYPGLLSNHK